MSVPALRFKDDNGREFPEWINNALEKFSDTIQSGKSKERRDTGEYVLYGSTGAIGFSDNSEYQGKNILIARVGANAGYIYEVDGCYCVSDNTLILSLKNPNNHSFFFNLLTKSNLNKLVFGSGQPLITGGLLKSLNVAVPSIPEQTKIANFLTAVDEKISQLTQKHDLLTQYKKGVMQQIFSQELRFKDDDGRDFPEWDFKELEKVATKVNKKNKGLSISNVLTNSATQGIVSQSDYFDRDIANQNNLGGYYIVERDDFVYNPRISANALVGPIKRNNLTVGVMSPLYTVFRFTKGNLNFYEQYFQTNGWHDYMKSISNTGARHDRMNITNESFFSLPLPYPVEKEQIKIANFLTAIDDKIAQSQAELDAVTQYKQGLLQQMFI